MLKTYYKIACRTLLKNKVFSSINILGLATGIAAFVMIFQYVQFEWSYDTFQKESDNIYRVRVDLYHNGELESENAFTVPALGPLIINEVPGIEDYFRLTSWAESYTIISQEQHADELVSFKEQNAIFADPLFVKYFSLNLIRRTSDLLLAGPNKVIISESAAERYFGKNWLNENSPFEKNLLVYNSNRDREVAFQVEGVFKDMPQNSHLQYDIIFSHKTLPEFLPREIPEEERLGMFENSWGPNAWYTYLVLNPEVKIEEVTQQINEVVSARNQNENNREVYTLQPIKDIHLHSHLLNEPTVPGNSDLVYMLSTIAVFLLVIAWINYINLSTARAIDRAKEVGLRKVAGARRQQLISQFLLEATLVNIIALILAFVIVLISIPVFNQFFGFDMVVFSQRKGVLLFTLGIVMVIGVLFTGIYPALILSSFSPVAIFQNRQSSASKEFNLRKILVVFQFVISIVMIAGTLVIFRQVQFMRQQDLGIQTSQTLVIEGPNVIDQEISFLQTVDFLRNQLKRNPSISRVSATSNVPGKPEGLRRMISRIGRSDIGVKEITEINVDYSYMETMDIDLLAGRYFSEDEAWNRQKVILNQAAMLSLGFKTHEEAIGAKIGTQFAWGITEYDIIGVTENYHQNSLQHGFKPIVFFYEIYSGSYIVRIEPDQNTSAGSIIAFLEAEWKALLPDNPFHYYFLDTYFDQQYQADRRFGKIFTLFSLTIIIIACLGLFGLASYTTLRRTKEIGIRKVMGASVSSILALLSKDFINLILFAGIPALPLSYWTIHLWLQNYAFRIEISWWLLVLPMVLVLLLALVTVSVHTLRAAYINPVKSLRYE